jgi:hypothetical protein
MMRSRIVVPLVAIGLLVVVALVVLRPRTEPALPQVADESAAPAQTNPVLPAAAVQPAPVSTQASVTPGSDASVVSGGVSNVVETPERQHEAYVERRIGELADLSAEDDSASLETILSELGNADARIRKAAVDAAVQFGSRDAIPELQEAMERTADAEEKKALAEAIEFLKLPSLTEVLAEKQKAAQTSAAAAPSAK